MSMGSTATTRKALHAYVTDECHEQWHSFAADEGVSVSALLEVLGLSLSYESVGTFDTQLRVIVRDARRLDARRRRRVGD